VSVAVPFPNLKSMPWKAVEIRTGTTHSPLWRLSPRSGMKVRKMPISSRTFIRSQLLFFVVGVLALSAIVFVGFWLAGRSDQISKELLSARDLKTQVTELRAAIQRAESSQRGFLYTSN